MAHILFTSRWGGFSTPPYDEMNLALHVGDSPDTVIENRKILDLQLFLPANQHLIYMNQTHSTKIAEVDGNFSGVAEADAIVCRQKNIGLAVLVADCLPLLVHAGEFTAAIHVGREGLINGIIENTLNYILSETLKIDQGRKITVKATLGPSICGGCYTLNEEHFSQIILNYPDLVHDIKNHSIDIPMSAMNKINKWCAENSGFLSGEVLFSHFNICTFENHDFYSHRRQNPTGRFAGVIINDGVFS
jgi:YfiH family protein